MPCTHLATCLSCTENWTYVPYIELQYNVDNEFSLFKQMIGHTTVCDVSKTIATEFFNTLPSYAAIGHFCTSRNL